MMKKYALIVAAGSGSRMQSEIPKQFLLLNGKPIYYYSVHAFLESYADIEIILILPQNYSYKEEEIVQYFEQKKTIKIIRGGATRFESVKNGLAQVAEGIVFIHDAVRPFIDKVFLDTLLQEAIVHGNAIPYTDVVESLRFADAQHNHALDRQYYKAIQTPQVFQTEIIKKAFNQNYQEIFTDDASVIESIGEKINLVKGLTENIKITKPIDLDFAELLLKNWK